MEPCGLSPVRPNPDTIESLLVSCTHTDHPLAAQLRQFITDAQFPCVGAKAALAKGRIVPVMARSITSAWDDLAIHHALMEFVGEVQQDPRLFQSFAVIFEGPHTLDEEQFEEHMWHRLQSMSDKDRWLGQPYSRQANPDPSDPHFALSYAGEAFFVVGLHPHASRQARRFATPTLIFNTRAQFDQLRAEGRYEKMHSTIIERDLKLSGSINPMLARHGETSEARQYSGRAVDENWECAFRYTGLRDAT